MELLYDSIVLLLYRVVLCVSLCVLFFVFFFFFQAEDGIRDHCVTGVQTCALPICPGLQLIDLIFGPD